MLGQRVELSVSAGGLNLDKRRQFAVDVAKPVGCRAERVVDDNRAL